MGRERIKTIEEPLKHLGNTSLKSDPTPFDPKFIRGPTEYKPIQRGKNKPRAKGSKDTMKEVSLKPRQGESPSAKFVDNEDFDQAQISMGQLPDKRRVLLTVRKTIPSGLANTYSDQSVDMVRAKALYRRDMTTYAENMDEAFCHMIDEQTTSDHFMRYLEAAAHASETEALADIFPFLDQSGHVMTLQRLLRERAELESSFPDSTLARNSELVQELNSEIDQIRAKIYDDHLKKVQFKTSIEKVLKAAPETTESDEKETEFWLWVWLRKLLNVVVENIKETQEIVQEALGESPPQPTEIGMVKD